jgi:hypothetical protein
VGVFAESHLIKSALPVADSNSADPFRAIGHGQNIVARRQIKRFVVSLLLAWERYLLKFVARLARQSPLQLFESAVILQSEIQRPFRNCDLRRLETVWLGRDSRDADPLRILISLNTGGDGTSGRRNQLRAPVAKAVIAAKAMMAATINVALTEGIRRMLGAPFELTGIHSSLRNSQH